ncbi:MAG: FAD-binding protein [Pyrobaculum sp.]|uniref:FAD-binding protein n=1 Tax=Pyrobaculum sp. TaxID=2004705 RepID=UPI003CB65033
MENKLFITPVFHSTSLSGNAATVDRRTIVLSSERMNKILEVSDVDWLAVVQPGIKIDELNLELMGYGLQWPVPRLPLGPRAGGRHRDWGED